MMLSRMMGKDLEEEGQFGLNSEDWLAFLWEEMESVRVTVSVPGP